jgi:O-antigen/teichoic acid export membrane protein
MSSGESGAVVKSGVHTVATNLVQVVGVFVTTAIIARSMGPTGKGTYDLYMTSVGLLSIVLGFSLTSGVAFVVASARIDLVKLLRYLTAFAILQGGVALLVAAFVNLTPLKGVIVPKQLGPTGIVLVAFSVLAVALSSSYRSVLAGQRRFIRANYGDLAKQGVGILLLLIAIAVVSSAGLDLLWAFIAANLIAVLVAAGIYRASIRIDHDGSSTQSGLKQAFRFALPSYLATLVQFLNYRVDVFFVSSILGNRELGLYQLAVFLSQSLSLVPGAAQSVLFPTFAAAQTDPHNNALKLAQANRLIFLLSLVSGLLLIGFASWGIEWIFGESFRGSVAALYWLVPGTVAFSTTTVVAGYFAGMGRPNLNMFVSIISLAVTIPLDILLIPRWGIVGAAIASTASYTMSSIISATLFSRLTGVSTRDLMILKRDDLPLIRAIVDRILRSIHIRVGTAY